MKIRNVERPASRGIAIGKAYVVEKQELIASGYTAGNPQEEIKKYEDAVNAVADSLETLAGDNPIFAAHLELVRDMALAEGVKTRILGGSNAEQALSDTIDEFRMIFEMMDDEYMRERAADIQDIRNRLMCRLKGMEETSFDGIQEEVILIARDLAPSDTAKLDLNLVLGFITQEGGVTSHVSIMARNVGLPALVGVEQIMEEVATGDEVILDAVEGAIVLNPDGETRAQYREKQEKFRKREQELESVSHLPAVSEDGHKVQVCANVGSLDDISLAVTKGIDGIGLFRSEFLYMDNTHFPTEEEQYEVYKKAARLCEGEVIIRTLDIGGDKALPYYTFDKEENPFLGWRAIRISLDLRDVFKAQLRALLRASAYGKLCIMYPMIISLEELQEANQILTECKEELIREGKAFNPDIRVGMMIETPAAVLNVRRLAKEVDFFSIGTNDLTQYLLAVDRGNQKIAKMYDSFHPAVLTAIRQIIDAGHEAGIPVGMCGEFASDEKAVQMLLGMGLDEFSVNAGAVAGVKYRIRSSSYRECTKLADDIRELYTIKEVMERLQ